jgi:hypothetical protein
MDHLLEHPALFELVLSRIPHGSRDDSINTPLAHAVRAVILGHLRKRNRLCGTRDAFDGPLMKSELAVVDDLALVIHHTGIEIPLPDAQRQFFGQCAQASGLGTWSWSNRGFEDLQMPLKVFCLDIFAITRPQANLVEWMSGPGNASLLQKDFLVAPIAAGYPDFDKDLAPIANEPDQ